MKTGTLAILAALSVVTLTTTGCKTANWKMPGAKWLSWNREPDAATLTGGEDLPGLPVSPASKYSPGTIASVGAQNSSQPGSTSSLGSGSAYGYTGQTVATPKAGLAAQANGYQTGPYQTGPSSLSATAGGSYAPAASNSMGNLPNPYGGSYSGSAGSTSTPNLAMSSNVPGISGNSAVSPSTYPNTQLPSSTSSPRNSTISYPVGTTGLVPPTAVTSGLPAYPSMPAASGSSTVTNAYTGNTTRGASPLGSASAAGPSPVGASALGVSSASPSVGPAAGYAPGTTGRNTNYNFGPSSTPSIASPPNSSGIYPLQR